MLKTISFQDYFKKPKARDIVEERIAEYERQMLDHQAQTDYHLKMSQYYQDGIARLQRFKPAQLPMNSLKVQ